MLEDYKEIQKTAYNIMMNEIKKNHVSHAYLIDENGNSNAFDFVMSFIKEVLTFQLDKECGQVLRKRIDDGNYPEIKIIEPDGMFIKKQQILDLQQEFSRAAIEGNKRVYIIRDVDKMRSETANSMLKFLEEPDNDIMAILMTNNFNNLLSTIVSRCQIIRLNNNVSDSGGNEFDQITLNFIKSIENNGIRTIAREQELLFNTISTKEREKFVILFDKMIDMYYDILKIFNGIDNVKFDKFHSELSIIAGLNTEEKILNKISVLMDLKDTIKNNVGINLLIDSLIVSVGGMYEGSRS